MAPEQVRGDTLDRRADLFAFGAVLYEILRRSGPAFPGATHVERGYAVLKDEPPRPFRRPKVSLPPSRPSCVAAWRSVRRIAFSPARDLALQPAGAVEASPTASQPALSSMSSPSSPLSTTSAGAARCRWPSSSAPPRPWQRRPAWAFSLPRPAPVGVAAGRRLRDDGDDGDDGDDDRRRARTSPAPPNLPAPHLSSRHREQRPLQLGGQTGRRQARLRRRGGARLRAPARPHRSPRPDWDPTTTSSTCRRKASSLSRCPPLTARAGSFATAEPGAAPRSLVGLSSSMPATLPTARRSRGGAP